MALATITNEMSIRDNVTFALTPPNSINAYKLVANTAIDISVSALVDANAKKANVLLFNSTGKFYVKWNGTGATVPAASITDGTAPELTPTVRRIGGGMTQFSIVAPADCIVTMSIFTLNN